ncbi:MAG TPA: phytanoyl-CoA dioxygenase family protein [Chthonomonadaceae bacterium]|nr:phytanoyl-CoA dioxygenase family protein [Chthonomonadaceae bacterium]
MNRFHTTADQVAQFQRDGYLMVPALFDAEEMDLLLQIGKADQEKVGQIHDVKDAQGRISRLWLTADTDREDIYNGFCHSRRIVDTMEALLGDEVYLYHYKMMVKEPKVGGAWEWHQDYGYWYHNGCLFPDMASCYIAVDRAHRGNGCLQVIQGSHRMGRIEHGTFGGQTGADPTRVELALQHLERIYCEMEPGSALFFHCNLLHSSDPNLSEDPRWGLICCYNTRHNPCKDLPGHPSYTPLEKWEDSRIKELGRRQLAELQRAGKPGGKG